MVFFSDEVLKWWDLWRNGVVRAEWEQSKKWLAFPLVSFADFIHMVRLVLSSHPTWRDDPSVFFFQGLFLSSDEVMMRTVWDADAKKGALKKK